MQSICTYKSGSWGDISNSSPRNSQSIDVLAGARDSRSVVNHEIVRCKTGIASAPLISSRTKESLTVDQGIATLARDIADNLLEAA